VVRADQIFKSLVAADRRVLAALAWNGAKTRGLDIPMLLAFRTPLSHPVEPFPHDSQPPIE
jgi:hypothetical protein